MVHIPFLNIEVPEVRLAQFIPAVFKGGLGACSKLVEAAWDYTHPLPRPVEELYVKDVMCSFPREFQRVFKRGLEGRHKNDDIMSSEMEDAAFDYYRRQIRSSIVGETDEDIEDVAAYNLGLDRPSAREQAWTQHGIDNGSLEVPENDVDDASPFPPVLKVKDPRVRALMVEMTPMELASIEKWIKAYDALGNPKAPPAVKGKGSSPRSPVGHAVATSFSAGLGLTLGVVGLRGLSHAIRFLRSKLNLGKKQGKGAKRSAVNAVPKKNQRTASVPNSSSPVGQSQPATTAPAASSKPNKEATAETKARTSTRAATKKR